MYQIFNNPLRSGLLSKMVITHFFCMEENEYFSILANILNAQVGYVSAGKCITVNK